MYTENYKTLMREIKEDLNRWKTWGANSPKLIYRLNSNPSKSLAGYLHKAQHTDYCCIIFAIKIFFHYLEVLSFKYIVELNHQNSI